jgi:hypothetical protein
MSDDTPTLRLATTPPPAPPPPPPAARPEPPSRGPLVAFILLAILVVAAIGVLVWVLMGRANTSAQSANTPTATDTSAAPAAPSQPPSPPGAFSAFTVPSSQQCRGHGKDQQPVDAQVTWATTNATQVWVSQGTTDAESAGTLQVPLSGDQNSFPDPLSIDCNDRSETFTMTLVGADGAHVSRTWTVMIEGRHG